MEETMMLGNPPINQVALEKSDNSQFHLYSQGSGVSSQL